MAKEVNFHNIMKSLGRNLSKARDAKEYPQEYVEYKTGVAQETISQLENGNVGKKGPLLITVYKLASFLGVKIDDLVNGE